MPNKNCKYCEGTGIKYIPNGEDDFDAEICKCTYEEGYLVAQKKKTLTEEIMSFLYDQGKKLK